MSTATVSPTTKAQVTKTKNDVTKAKNDATAAARSASADAKRAASKAKGQSEAIRTGVVKHSKRVSDAAQAEVKAVSKQPTRPLFFALGIVDRYVESVKELPSNLRTTPGAFKDRIVGTFATAGDVAERAQKGYTEVAKDGESLVSQVRKQDSTQRAIRLAERARTRGRRAVKDTEQAIEAAGDAAAEAVQKIG